MLEAMVNRNRAWISAPGPRARNLCGSWLGHEVPARWRRRADRGTGSGNWGGGRGVRAKALARGQATRPLLVGGFSLEHAIQLGVAGPRRARRENRWRNSQYLERGRIERWRTAPDGACLRSGCCGVSRWASGTPSQGRDGVRLSNQLPRPTTSSKGWSSSPRRRRSIEGGRRGQDPRLGTALRGHGDRGGTPGGADRVRTRSGEQVVGDDPGRGCIRDALRLQGPHLDQEFIDAARASCSTRSRRNREEPVLGRLRVHPFFNNKRPLTKPDHSKGLTMRSFSSGDADTVKRWARPRR